MRKISTVVAVFALAASTHALAQPDTAVLRESVVQIAVFDGEEIARLGSGFAISDDYVLTAAHVVAGEEQVVAVPLTTGAELLARIVYISERVDLALLAVNGLDLPPLALAVDGFAPGRSVYSSGVWSEAEDPIVAADAGDEVMPALTGGSVGRHSEIPGADKAPAVLLMEHNAMFPAAGYGGPVLNECGEVAGINRGAPGLSLRRLRRAEAPQGVAYAVRAPSVAGLLETQGIGFSKSEESCASALAAAQAQAAEAEAQAEEAAAQAEEAAAQAEEAAAQAQETQEQLEQTQQEKEQAATRMAEAESRVGELEAQYEEAVRAGDEQAETLRVQLDAARDEQEAARGAVGTLEVQVAELEERLKREAEADQTRLIVTLSAAAVLLVLVAAVALIGSRRRSRQVAVAREEAARAQRAAADARARPLAHDSAYPDCVLTGETGEGHPVSVKIPGALLGGEGAVIGRSPRNATLLIDDRTLSREHARLFGDGESLYVEDLGTTNGTRVNGRDLVSGRPVPVRQGDTLELGAVKVELLLEG